MFLIYLFTPIPFLKKQNLYQTFSLQKCMQEYLIVITSIHYLQLNILPIFKVALHEMLRMLSLFSIKKVKNKEKCVKYYVVIMSANVTNNQKKNSLNELANNSDLQTNKRRFVNEFEIFYNCKWRRKKR